MSIAELDVEEATLVWFEQLEYIRRHGTDVSPGGMYEGRANYQDVILKDRLHEAIAYLNPYLSDAAVQEVFQKITRLDHPDLVERNRQFHKYLVEGVSVENRRKDGSVRTERARIIDFAEHGKKDKNDWLVVNQFTVMEQGHERRPDIVVFVNGLPLVVIELKNPAAEKATIRAAFQQLQTYKREIPSLLTYNEILVVSDGIEARAGTLTADWERFQPWRTVDGVTIAPKGEPELKTLLPGIFEKSRFLDLLRSFIVFESDGVTISKKMAAYHQYHAVNKAVATTIKACSQEGDRRAGVIWHTQGSGKSLTMVFYAGKIIQEESMENPTLVILTDRNDLDEQLFGTFSRCQDIIRQEPVQATERDDIKDFLKDKASGGVIFTTLQKFMPEEGAEYPRLSDRKNIIFIADEAHRSQYGLEMHIVKDKETNEGRIAYGFAKYLRDALPNASFIGFTGTPIEASDKDTRAIFGDYIDVYDIHRSVEDGATVRIYYEARTVPLKLDEEKRPQIDPTFENVTRDREQDEREKLKSKWGRQEALIGADDRIKKIAADIVEHFEKRQRDLTGKAMIVCMNRVICVELYDEIINLRPAWHHSDDDKGEIKVVMTGSASDATFMQPHIRPQKKRREALALRFKDANDPLKLVIVCDMWLTGFDVPCLHTMYLDKRMEGHGLMQAIARVNRVFKDKPGGLIVDYLGLAEALREALHDYSREDQEAAGIDQEKAVDIMQEKYEVVRGILYGFDYSGFFGNDATVKLSILPAAMEHILSLDENGDEKQNEGKKRFMNAVTALLQAYRLALPHDRAIKLRNEIGFFLAIRAAFVKATPTDGKTREDLDAAVGQIVSEAITAGEVIDVYSVLGVKNPNVALLSDEFLDEMRNLPHKRLAFEVLEKLLKDQIRANFRTNVVKAQSFESKLAAAVKQYQERAIEAAIIMLQANAKEIRDTLLEDAQSGMTPEALAYYDALKADNETVKDIEEKRLQAIAEELVNVIRENVSIDWTIRERARADLRRMISRCLRKNGYPLSNRQPEAVVELIVKQAEALSKDWNAA